jgi:protein tyrosine phosphatase (PTP) superfamily phosphohydrolase (DUF442 family)
LDALYSPSMGKRSMRILLGLVAVLGLVAAVAPRGFLPWSRVPGVHELPARWTEARKGWLYRSAQIPPHDVEDVLRAQKIGVLIDLTDDDGDPGKAAEAKAAADLGIRYVHFPVEHPREKVMENLAAAVAEIAKAHQRGDRVLVHCTYGHRRSSTTLALYARIIEHEPKHVAYAELTRYSEADSSWSGGVVTWLDKNTDEIAAQVKEDLAKPDQSVPPRVGDASREARSEP